MGEGGGNIVCGEKQKTPLYNSLKKTTLFFYHSNSHFFNSPTTIGFTKP